MDKRPNFGWLGSFNLGYLLGHDLSMVDPSEQWHLSLNRVSSIKNLRPNHMIPCEYWYACFFHAFFNTLQFYISILGNKPNPFSHFYLFGLRCNITSLLLEMDRILRPGGYAYIYDSSSVIEKVQGIARAMGWKTSLHYTAEGPYESKRLLICDKILLRGWVGNPVSKSITCSYSKLSRKNAMVFVVHYCRSLIDRKLSKDLAVVMMITGIAVIFILLSCLDPVAHFALHASNFLIFYVIICINYHI